MIRVENLIFDYPGKRVLDDISFRLPKGSITALVGANGVGKTTLMRCMAALHAPLSGTVYLDGLDVQEQPRESHRLLGYLPDFFGLYNELTVSQHLIFAAQSHDRWGQERDRMVRRTAERLRLTERMNERAAQLSRGWRQRLGIAQAIIHEPRLLFLDEPASGLDPAARRDLSELFQSLRDLGMTLLVSSHILAELAEYSTHMLTLHDGKNLEVRLLNDKQTTSHRSLRLTLVEPQAQLTEILAPLEGVTNIQVNDDGSEATFLFSGDQQQQHQLLRTFLEKNLLVCALAVEQENLQDSYLAQLKTPSLAAGKGTL